MQCLIIVHAYHKGPQVKSSFRNHFWSVLLILPVYVDTFHGTRLSLVIFVLQPRDLSFENKVKEFPTQRALSFVIVYSFHPSRSIYLIVL